LVLEALEIIQTVKKVILAQIRYLAPLLLMEVAVVVLLVLLVLTEVLEAVVADKTQAHH